MNIIKKVKDLEKRSEIKTLIKQKKYDKLKIEILKAEKDNQDKKVINTMLRIRILEILSESYEGTLDDKKVLEIFDLLYCASLDYVPVILDDLIADKAFPNSKLNVPLMNHKVSKALCESKEKYIKIFMDDLKDSTAIMLLYYSVTTTENEKKFIEQELKSWVMQNPDSLANIIFHIAFALKVFTIRELENMVIKNKDLPSYELLLAYPESNKNRLLNELGKIKDESAANKKVFLNTISKYNPEVLNEVSYGSYVKEVVEAEGLSPLDNAKIFENAHVAIRKMINEKNEGELDTPNNKDDKETIEELEPPVPAYRDYGKPPKAHVKVKKLIKLGKNGVNHF